MVYLEGAKTMPQPELTVIGEGHLPSGEHWILRAGGTEDDYNTYLETVHPDGHRDEGGMGGPTLYGEHINVYTGRHDQGLRRVIVRSDAQVRRVLAELDTGEQIEVPSVGNDPAMGLTFYAALLPRSVRPTFVNAFDSEGRVIAQGPLR
jgi:hypothetical protein